MNTQNLDVAKVIELISGLIGLGYTKEQAADSAKNLLGIRGQLKPGKESKYPINEIIALIGNGELCWKDWKWAIISKFNTTEKTAENRIRASIESGKVSVRISGVKKFYSKTEAAK